MKALTPEEEVALNMARESDAEQRFSRPLPPDLYHYTDQKGLLGIFESENLWATKVQYLNDYRELELSVDLARERLTHWQSKSQSAGVEEKITKIIAHLNRIAHVNICAVSFCEDHNLLSQWRGYSGGGGGVSVGFRSKALIELAAKQGGRLGVCIYDRKCQNKVISEIVDDIIESVEDNEDLSNDVALFGNRLNAKLVENGAFFKDDGFQEEREWRLVTGVLDYRSCKFKFRVGPSMLIPYHEVPLDSVRDKISSVTIGPCPFPESSRQAILGLSINKGLYLPTRQGWGPQEFQVRLSQIPYRSW